MISAPATRRSGISSASQEGRTSDGLFHGNPPETLTRLRARRDLPAASASTRAPPRPSIDVSSQTMTDLGVTTDGEILVAFALGGRAAESLRVQGVALPDFPPG